MAREYSVQTCQALAERVRAAGLYRPMRIKRYEAGEELTYQVTGVWPARHAAVRVKVEKFVGGGYAGQVYRVKVLAVDGQAVAGLNVGGAYALKILVPPSSFGRRFRDAIYWVGFGGAFSLQALPAALRAGSLWQKLIRRAAGFRLGDEQAIADVLGTFVDDRIGSCGEIRQWVEGRQWRFEVDDRLDARWRRRPPEQVADGRAGSPEYRAKRVFMMRLVDLMHELGAPELARQYEWWTCKSQPNVLKRDDREGDPAGGLTAVDFRAGLALLPFLPMSPGDVRLILKGVGRGSLVQFDRGDLNRLRRFVAAHADQFVDMQGALDELQAAESEYRDALPDLTHHHLRLLYDRRLWSGILDGAITSWQVRNTADAVVATRLRRSRVLTLVFAIVGFAPLLAGLALAALGIALAASGSFRHWVEATLTWLGLACGAVLILAVALGAKGLRGLWGRADLRRHYGRMLTSLDYLRRSVRAHIAERLIDWHRAGRVGSERALRLAAHPARYLAHLPFSALPAGAHRFLTDRRFAWDVARYIVARPLRLYFSAEARAQWLRDMVEQGRRHGMLSDEEHQRIVSQIKEPFIQKYLKNLAVHVCLAPTTHVVALAVGVYLAVKYGKTWGESWAIALGTMAFFQVIPISPGSVARGLYVLYLVISERNFRDYNPAVFLAFFKYVGYLAFPVQMAYRYPALARFMAGHWATGAVHFVPVFGERGALLEHAVFDIFYNYLLTLRRRIRLREQARTGRGARRWHAPLCAALGAGALAAIDLARLHCTGRSPSLKATWYLAFWPVLAAGWATAAGAGGMRLSRRIALSVASGVLMALLAAGWQAGLAQATRPGEWAACLWNFATTFLWHALYFAFPALLGALLAETRPAENEQ